MTNKVIPCDLARLEQIATEYPTPFYLYDEHGIREAARQLRAAFAWAPAFTEHFAVKAAPTPALLRVLREEGCGADCSSLAELILAERAGIGGEAIMFTSNNTPAEEYQKAVELGAVVNLDDIEHLEFLARHACMPGLISFRYNPGPLRAGNTIIGNPVEAKFGVTREQLFQGYARARALGVRRFGLHTMVVSNELELDALLATARMLFELVVELVERHDVRVEFVNLGGGIGIPYRPEQQAVDLAALGAGVRAAYEELIVPNGLHPLHLRMECGRVITGPHGYLVARVRHVKQSYRRYVGLDASMADLMRPGMYGAYHHVSVPARAQQPHDQICDVVGSLCENNDKFAIERMLPAVEPGDLVIIHDAGAHGRAMGFNYNGKLRPAELLLRENGAVQLIRRRETLEDLFATLVD